MAYGIPIVLVMTPSNVLPLNALMVLDFPGLPLPTNWFPKMMRTPPTGYFQQHDVAGEDTDTGSGAGTDMGTNTGMNTGTSVCICMCRYRCIFTRRRFIYVEARTQSQWRYKYKYMYRLIGTKGCQHAEKRDFQKVYSWLVSNHCS